MEALIILVVYLGGYMLPTIVGTVRHKRNLAAIAVLNLLLGWTLIGWVVALVWALVKDPAAMMHATPEQAVRTIDESEDRITRARVWIAVVAVLAALMLWGYYVQ